MVVSRQKAQLASKLDAVHTRWFELSANEENVTVFRLTQFFQTVTRVLELTEALSDKTAEAEMNVLKSDLQSMLNLISSGPDSSGETKPLPKSIRTALLKLASQPQVESVRAQIMAIINEEQPEVVALDFESLPEGTWKEGTEEYATLTLDKAWEHLGLGSIKRIPGFAEKLDLNDTYDPWSIEGLEVLRSEEAVPLELKWHQVIGVIKLVDNLLAGKPVLLMDEVGIGKTMQAVAFCLYYDYMRQYFDEHGHFPGKWRDVKYKGGESNLPDLPMVICMPAALHPQWQTEIRRYVQQGWVDLLPYTGTHKSRSKWWDDVYAKSHHSPSRRIILATHTAMSSDSEVAFRLADKKMRDARKHGDVREKGRYRASTLYGHKFGVFALDESHVVRTLNTIYTAARQLRIQSETMVALTATPVMTKATVSRHFGFRYLND
ncbi:hypothetical protein POSPLADRAFT_1163264 [Postia placenta MAD-698-R-SB12]|uniref:Helicase ATP-binding domain-containing protein n=1 Tax=Postia placenta MAD-698-R-SB12 TaxID=670580 RepID=A0A1X6MHT3_9APHY|nr:hypothetical protein POSPLADRAFT_1163264 [Postia placenta MAD-698-R-SB12]OSX55772.1 hypothetical protein POSPLADRAFT_1163264 [Postia placenta MAD-698-R-SB12]